MSVPVDSGETGAVCGATAGLEGVFDAMEACPLGDPPVAGGVDVSEPPPHPAIMQATTDTAKLESQG